MDPTHHIDFDVAQRIIRDSHFLQEIVRQPLRQKSPDSIPDSNDTKKKLKNIDSLCTIKVDNDQSIQLYHCQLTKGSTTASIIPDNVTINTTVTIVDKLTPITPYRLHTILRYTHTNDHYMKDTLALTMGDIYSLLQLIKDIINNKQQVLFVSKHTEFDKTLLFYLMVFYLSLQFQSRNHCDLSKESLIHGLVNDSTHAMSTWLPLFSELSEEETIPIYQHAFLTFLALAK